MHGLVYRNIFGVRFRGVERNITRCYTQGAYIPGGETRSQSADRCVMRQRSGASVFFERIWKERDFVALSLCGFYSGFMRSFKKFLT